MTKTFTAAVAFALAATFAAQGAQAAGTTGRIELKGSVARVCEITVTDLRASLDLVAGERGKKIASVEEHCNNHDGYTVSFTSGNRGALRNGDGDTVPYTINYDNQSRKSLSKKLDLKRSKAQFREGHDLYVNVDASTTRVAGDYADTVTVTIKAN